MKKLLLSACVITSIGTMMLGTAVNAQEATGYGIFVGNVEITSANTTIDSEDNGSGVTAGSLVYDHASGTLTATDAVVVPDGAAALHIKPGAEVELVLEGENEFTGDVGCAGIWVEAGWDTEDGNWIFNKDKAAKLTVSGEGSLLTTGGDAFYDTASGGAGIGGNGVTSANTDGGDFGVITIESGNIKAFGGDDDMDSYPPAGSAHGAAAGIGGGGIDGGWKYAGIINIEGGTVTAYGGNGWTGAAGIGSGNAGSSYGTESDIVTVISGGKVTAYGGTDAAGIGGSSNGASGSITISGGTVTAFGGDEDDGSSSGGAGIGGGDNGEAGEIIICGDAKVTATAGGAAAGIGGGKGGYVTTITIKDSAKVTAFGGTSISQSSGAVRGGAAIGSGHQGDFGVDFKTGNIVINTTGKIVAYGGGNAMSIGVGTEARSNYYFNVGTKTGEIWMFNQGTAQPAYIDDPEYLTNYKATLTAQYTHTEGEEYPEKGVVSKAITLPGSVDIDWKYENNVLSVIRDNEVIISGEYVQGYELGNWAVVIPQVDMYVTYEWDGDIPDGEYEQTIPEGKKVNYGDIYDVDTTFTANSLIENMVDGVKVGEWTFSGWDKTGSIEIGDSTTIKGTWTYNAYLVVEFEKSVDEEGTPIEERDERIYDINIVSYGKAINRLNSGDLTFVLGQINGKNTYEIIDIPGDDISVEYVDGDRYEFHFDTKSDVTNDSGMCVTVARVKFTGYGKFDFVVDGDVDTNSVHTTTQSDNIVDSYAPGGVLDNKTVGVLVISDKIEEEIFAPTQNLTIKIAFPNAIENNALAYQTMNVLVTGEDIANISINLGTDNQGEALLLTNKNEAAYTVAFDEAKSEYTIEIVNALTANTAYNVAVSGAGYRTARYTVNTQETDKTLNFWNNVKDNAINVEEGKDSSAKTVTFLAGDIVKDAIINIYDLSAVVSYFGEIELDEDNNAAYAKYDLNRDGNIDSKDVAYVLVSWGK